MKNNFNEEYEPIILIVDDVHKNIELLGNILSEEDYEIAIGENGRHALEVIEDVTPDLILLDVMMPEMDGYETCKRLKENIKTKEIPIIFLTAKTETEDIVKGFKLGAVDYVTKPFNATELLSRVKTHLELKRSRDIQKENLKVISEKNQKLEELNILKNEFLGIAAHDLRNPIAAVKMISSLILNYLNENLSEEQIELLNELEDIGEFMGKLLNDLLDITAIESGKLKLDLIEQNYREFLEHNLKINKPLAAEKNISIELDIKEEIQKVVFDKNKLTQVLNNLISNAVKYSHSGTKITIQVSTKEDTLVTSVIDQGQGIPEKELSLVFKAFQKTSVAATAGEKSTGLGLAITKKIIEGHRGEIKVESKEGEGSVFSFILPLDTNIHNTLVII